ncbi:MAG TPA: cyclic peptide export ABC transporter [Pyrinomonadaceae bacterium]|nr:cyclic peptide export ABC transporter [Pyrinomonadaceae bacterium]
MKLLSFLLRYSPRSVVLAVVAGVISGASNAGLLALFTAALRGEQYSKMTLVWSFVALCLFLPLTRFVSEMLLTRLAQGALYDLRMQLSRQIMAAPLRHFEDVGVHRLMTALTDDIPVITNTLVAVPLLCINVTVVVGGLVYLGWLSGVALVAVLCFMAVGIFSYQLPINKATKTFRQAREDGDRLFGHFRDLTGGIKELKLHRRRREAFLNKVLHSTAASLRQKNIKGMTIYTAAASWGQSLVFLVVGVVLLALPMVYEMSGHVLMGYVITLLYLMTPLQLIMNTTPALSRASIALKKVEDLGLTLASKGTEDAPQELPDTISSWLSVELSGVAHTYRRENEKENFILGPIDMTLLPGEIVFLVGGNGSGKTTLSKILTGLYVPEEGEVLLNGTPVTDENREFYRQHFSMVFSDFHLFESLLGLERPNIDEHAREYLRRLQLDHKVEIKDGVLSTTELSQGQRKRLALLTAYLEDRPIYVFDEWAADQDPLFKEVFYYRLLPELKSRGKTVITISHDDRYYHVADRIIKLDYGKLAYDDGLTYVPPVSDEEPVAVG